MEVWFWPFAIAAGALAVLIGILFFAFWIWMIVDASKRKFKNDVEKVIWIIVIVLGSWVGALVYLLAVKLTNPLGLMRK